MRKWILVSVLTFVVGLHLAYTVSDRLMANDEPIGKPATAATPQNSTVTAPIPQQVPSVLGDPNAPPIDGVLAGTYFGHPVNAMSEVPAKPQPAYAPPSGMVIDTGWSSPPGSPKLGTFTIVSDGKRSILLNTSTGDSWTLVIDGQGSHWEPVAMGVAAQHGQQAGTDSSLTHSERHQAARDARDQSVEARMLEQTEKHVRRLGDALNLETERTSELEESLAKANIEIHRLTDGVFEYRDEVAELKRELKKTQDSLKAQHEQEQALQDAE